MAKTTFEVADEVAEIAEKLIPENHAHLLAHGVRMVYLFRDDTPKKNGKLTMGVARKVTGVHAFLAGAEIDLADGRTGEAFFAIVMTRPIWEELTPAQKEALTDHELSHCAVKFNKAGELVLVVKPHDLEEFNTVVERHGLWQRDVERFLKAARKYQPELPLEDEEDAHAGNGAAPTLTIVADTVGEATEKLREAGKRAVESVTITPERARRMQETIDQARQEA